MMASGYGSYAPPPYSSSPPNYGENEGLNENNYSDYDSAGAFTEKSIRLGIALKQFSVNILMHFYMDIFYSDAFG